MKLFIKSYLKNSEEFALEFVEKNIEAVSSICLLKNPE